MLVVTVWIDGHGDWNVNRHPGGWVRWLRADQGMTVRLHHGALACFEHHLLYVAQAFLSISVLLGGALRTVA